jgi:hypothetical protein
MTSVWLRERPMRNGSGSSGTAIVRSPVDMRTVSASPLVRGRAATIGVAGVVGATMRGASGVASAARSPAIFSSSRG